MVCRFYHHLSPDEGDGETCEYEDAYCPMYSEERGQQLLCEDVSGWQCINVDTRDPDDAYERWRDERSEHNY